MTLSALTLAARLNDAEARLLGASDRHLSRGWIEGEYWRREQERIRREQEERDLERKRAEQAAAEARAERERERVAHNESIELWEEQVETELAALVKGAFTSDEEDASSRMAEATRKLLWDEYEEQVEVPEGDPWDFESQGGLMHPTEIEDPRTRWSALARAELADHPQALERVLEAIAGYEPPEHPGPTGRVKGRRSPQPLPRRVRPWSSWGCWKIAARRTDPSHVGV